MQCKALLMSDRPPPQTKNGSTMVKIQKKVAPHFKVVLYPIQLISTLMQRVAKQHA